MADRKYPYRVGTAAGAVINAESSLRALRDARLRRANFSGDLAIKKARDTAASAIRTSRSSLQGAVRNAEEIGSRNISEAARQARLSLKPVREELTKAGRNLTRVTSMRRNALQGIVERNPFLNPMNGNVPWTEAQRASAATGGRWARPWKVAAEYWGGSIKPQLQQKIADFGPRMEAAANRFINAEGGVQSAVQSGREAIRMASEAKAGGIQLAKDTFKPAVDFAVREGRSSVAAAEAAKAAAVTKAGTMTGVRGAILKTGDAIRGVVGGETAKKIGGAIASAPARVGLNLGGVKEVAGSIARSKLLAPERFVAKAAAKPISGYFGMIEKAGEKMFSGRGLIGAPGRALTSAKGNAIGFAVGSWIDAGLEAYDFFKEGGGKDTAGPIKWFGKGDGKGEPDGVFSNPEFYRGYFAGVGKKLTSALTFGFFGNDNGWIDKALGNDEASQRARQLDKEKQRNDALEADPVISAYRQAQKTHRDRMNAATALPSAYLTPQAGIRKYLGDIVAERDAQLARTDITDTGRANFEKKYAGYVEAALGNKAAQLQSEKNRSDYYGLVTGGRDYAKDYELAGKDPNAVKGFKEFNDKWAAFSAEDQVLYDHNEAKAAFDEARRARMRGDGNGQ